MSVNLALFNKNYLLLYKSPLLLGIFLPVWVFKLLFKQVEAGSPGPSYLFHLSHWYLWRAWMDNGRWTGTCCCTAMLALSVMCTGHEVMQHRSMLAHAGRATALHWGDWAVAIVPPLLALPAPTQQPPPPSRSGLEKACLLCRRLLERHQNINPVVYLPIHSPQNVSVMPELEMKFRFLVIWNQGKPNCIYSINMQTL